MLVERVKTSAGASSSRHETQLPCFLFRIRKKKNAKVLVLESCHQKSTEFQSYCNTIFLQPVFKIKTIKRESFFAVQTSFCEHGMQIWLRLFLSYKKIFLRNKSKSFSYFLLEYSLQFEILLLHIIFLKE